MKLAEALLLRADLQKKIASLRDRVVANAVVQEGDKPHEAPDQLLKEAFAAISELESLVSKINKANLATKLSDGRTLTDAIAYRDTLKQKHAILLAAIAGSRKDPARYGVREIKWVALLEVSKLQKQADDVAKSAREIDALIPQANWSGEIVG